MLKQRGTYTLAVSRKQLQLLVRGLVSRVTKRSLDESHQKPVPASSHVRQEDHGCASVIYVDYRDRGKTGRSKSEGSLGPVYVIDP